LVLEREQGRVRALERYYANQANQKQELGKPKRSTRRDNFVGLLTSLLR
jgi:hypothetical protein